VAQLEKQCEAYLGCKPNHQSCLNTAVWLLLVSDTDRQAVCNFHKEELEQEMKKQGAELRPEEDVVPL
jgi:hypothetical protein